MNRTTSVYLDLVRLGAALVVLVTHLAYPRFSGGLLIEWRTFGNDAVMVFFVLSGYVIAYTAATRDREPGTYALNRLARLYSVALPAIALTFVLDRAGAALAPALYDGFWYQADSPLSRMLAALTFTNELWFNSVRLFTNGPYWSLGYEFWYYVLFAAGWFLRGWRRTAALGLVCLVIGPKILLLLPVWLLGLLVYRINTRGGPGEAVGWTLLLGSIALYALFRGTGLRDDLLALTYDALGRGFVRSELRWSDEFLSSWIIGPLVACNFIGFHAVSHRLAGLFERCGPPIRRGAGYTFSIYLFHYPVLQFLAAVLPFEPTSPVRIAVLLGATVLVCVLLGTVTEQRKDAARAALRAIWGHTGARLLRRRAPSPPALPMHRTAPP